MKNIKFFLLTIIVVGIMIVGANAQEQFKVLNKVNYPKDLKNLSIKELNTLADEVRDSIIKKVNVTSGHMGPNLGVVEATIALHYVFDTPKDKLVWDVSHQSYSHKMLTGRKDGFIDPKNYHKYTGYTAPEESEYDLFKVGHTSTSIALATGLAKARDLKGDKENVIAFIGDGSLTGGEAFEGLNNASVLKSNFIVVVNDNGMSIAENQGGLAKHLQDLKDSKGKAKDNMFRALGFDYLYVDNGNNIEDLIKAFKQVKGINHPVVVHLHTEKGHGLPIALSNKENFHYTMPNVLDEKANSQPVQTVETYDSITTNYLLKEIKNGNNILVVSPATPSLVFTQEQRKEVGEHFVDVGIAEQEAVAMISGTAKNGIKAVLPIYSSFIQRAYDQISQDLALNNNPATILVNAASTYGLNDATHLGRFDIALVSNIPNLVYLAPTNKEEYLAMLDWSINKNKNHSVAIRVPTVALESTGKKDTTDYSKLNKFKVVEKGQDVAIIGVGNFFNLGKEVKEELKKQNINATLINPCFISGVDKELLEDLKKNHKLVITLEDGIIEGGFGQKIASFYGNSSIKVLNFGADKEFTDRATEKELAEKYHLTKDLIVKDIEKIIK